MPFLFLRSSLKFNSESRLVSLFLSLFLSFSLVLSSFFLFFPGIAARMCARHPDVPVVIDHLGKPHALLLLQDSGALDAGKLEEWRTGMSLMAALPQVLIFFICFFSITNIRIQRYT
jgi:hypothetical protein